jgi:iron complex outermembrane receptor protein
MRKTFRLSVSALAFIAGFAASAPALAQAAGTDDGPIIVTARRVEERLQDVPISITVYNQEELNRRNIVNGADLATYTPSLSVDGKNGTDRSTYAIRGFVQDSNTAPSVGVYFADVVSPRGKQDSLASGGGVSPGRFFDLQNVQVLKGPQGTLFGRNTTGGSVLLVPKKPTNRLEGYIEGSIGNYHMKRIQGVLNVPVADTVRLRLGVDRLKRDGYVINKSGIGPRAFDDVNYLSLRASLVVDLAPNLENYTIASYVKSDTVGHITKLNNCAPSVFIGGFACSQMQLAAASGDDFYSVRSDIISPRSKSREWQIINTTTSKASDTITLKNIVSYGNLSLDDQLQLTASNFRTPALPAIPGIVPNGFPSYPFPFVHVVALPNTKAVDMHTFTEEFQVQGSYLNDRLKWQTGVYYEKSGPNGYNGQGSAVLNSCTDAAALRCTDALGVLFSANFGLPPGAITIGSAPYTRDKFSFQDVGIYGQATYSLADNLKLTGGARYTWDKENVEVKSFTNAFAASTLISILCAYPSETLPTCDALFRQKSSAPTWNADIEYNPKRDTLLYAKYSRGYRAGGINSAVTVNLAQFKPEKVDSYEVGAKVDFRGTVPGRFNITGFYNNFSNQQVSVNFTDNPAVPGTLPPQVGVVNVGKSRIYGIEAEAAITPFAGFSLSVYYTYLNTRVRAVAIPDDTGQAYLINTSLRAGDELPLAPEHKMALSASYTLPLDKRIGKVTVGGTFSYIGKTRVEYTSRALLLAGITILDENLKPVTRDIGVVPSESLVNLSLDWKSIGSGPVDLSLFVTNLLKKKYYTSSSGFLVSTGIGSSALSEPRMFGARLRVSF